MRDRWLPVEETSPATPAMQTIRPKVFSTAGANRPAEISDDHGPQAMVAGAKLAVERGFVAAEQLLLVGAEAAVRTELEAHGVAQLGFEVVDAPDALDGSESPVEALKRKPHNSVAVGIGQVKVGRAHGFVSAGSTGLVVASAMFGLLAGL